MAEKHPPDKLKVTYVALLNTAACRQMVHHQYRKDDQRFAMEHQHMQNANLSSARHNVLTLTGLQTDRLPGSTVSAKTFTSRRPKETYTCG